MKAKFRRFCRRAWKSSAAGKEISKATFKTLSTLGIAVVIEPPLPLAWSKTFILKAETVESEIHILENVLLQETQETAYSLLETLAKSLHEERCDELGGAVITLGNVRDESPADEPVIHFVLPLSNALNL